MASDIKIFDQVVAAIREETGEMEAEITPLTTADDVPGWDSLAHVRIVLNVNERLGAKIEFKSTYSAANVGELIVVFERAIRA